MHILKAQERCLTKEAKEMKDATEVKEKQEVKQRKVTEETKRVMEVKETKEAKGAVKKKLPNFRRCLKFSGPPPPCVNFRPIQIFL